MKIAYTLILAFLALSFVDSRPLKGERSLQEAAEAEAGPEEEAFDEEKEASKETFDDEEEEMEEEEEEEMDEVEEEMDPKEPSAEVSVCLCGCQINNNSHQSTVGFQWSFLRSLSCMQFNEYIYPTTA
jgi:hypothetical protein